MNRYILDNNNKFHQLSCKLYNNLIKSDIHKLYVYDVDKNLIINNLFVNCDTSDLDDKDDDELIEILFINMNDTELFEYLKLFNNESRDLNKYIKFIDYFKYYQQTITSRNNSFIKASLNELSLYWENPVNTLLNNSFITRKFSNIDHNEEIKIIKNIMNINIENYKDSYMLENMFNENFHYNKRYFPSEFKYSLHTNNEIFNIFTQLPTLYLKYIFVCNLLSSRTHCHLILNNPELLELPDLQNMFKKYEIIFKYLISYAWISFTMEEYSNNILDNNKCILSGLAVQNFPIFPFSFQDINQNPYSCILLDKNKVNIENNCLTFPMLQYFNKYYGIANNSDIEKRIRLFIHNSDSNTILDCIDWNCSVITGSIIAACSQKCNPLLKIFRQEDKVEEITNEEYLAFFNKYYKDSDVDILCKANTNHEFVKIVYELYTKLSNTNKYEYVSYSAIHTSSMVITEEFIRHNLMKIIEYYNNPNLNVNYIKSNLHFFKYYFYKNFYVEWVRRNNQSISKFKLLDIYRHYFNPVNFKNFNIYFSNSIYDVRENNDCEFVIKLDGNNVAKFNNNIRFKFSFPQNSLTKQLEIFKTRNNNYMTTISKFHLAMVRAYWNGKYIVCMPSFVSSLMTGISSNCKYFSSTKDPIHIINKYRNRGYGVLLNDHEKIHMVYYNSKYYNNNTNVNKNKNKNNNDNDDNKFVNIYNIDFNNKSTIDNVFGLKLLNSPIYFNDQNENFNINYVLNVNDCFSYLVNNFKQYNLDWLVFIKPIDDNGNVVNIRKEFIDLVWNNVNAK